MGGHVPSSPPASPTPQATLPTPPPSTILVNDRTKWEREWLCELWLRAAASYRRGDRVDDCRNALQEAELLNKENVNLWVQVHNLLHPLHRELTSNIVRAVSLCDI